MSASFSLDALRSKQASSYSLGVALQYVAMYLKNVPLDQDPQTMSDLLFFFEMREAESPSGLIAGRNYFFKPVKRPTFPKDYAQYRRKIVSHVQQTVLPIQAALERLTEEKRLAAKAVKIAEQELTKSPSDAILIADFAEKNAVFNTVNARHMIADVADSYVTKPAKEWIEQKNTGHRISYVKKAIPPIPQEPEVPQDIPFVSKPPKSIGYRVQVGGKRAAPRAGDVADLLKICERHAHRFMKEPPDHIHENLTKLSEMFGWHDDYGKILSFVWACENVNDFADLIGYLSNRTVGGTKLRAYRILISRFTGVDYDIVCDAFAHTSPLREGGVLTLVEKSTSDDDDNKNKNKEKSAPIGWPVLNPNFLRMLDDPGMTLETLKQKYVGSQGKSNVVYPPMDVVSRHMDDAQYLNGLILGVAKGSGRRHVLLYSPPGHGKTYYVHAVGYNYNVPIIKLGEDRNRAEGAKSELTPKDRMADILIGKMLFGNTNVILLVDDADGILDYADAAAKHTDHTISKVLVLRLLEEGGLLWIVNEPDNIPDAVRSRFVAAYAFPELDRRQRVPMLFAKATELGYDPGHDRKLGQSLTHVAETFKLSPRDMDGLIRATKMVTHANPDLNPSQAFEMAANNNLPFIHGDMGDALSNEMLSEEFHLDLVNASIVTGFYDEKRPAPTDPESLIATLSMIVQRAPAIKVKGANPMMILTSGPSDAGKESLWRFIAASGEGDLDFIEGNFLEMCQDASAAIGRAMSRSKGKNNIYYWSGAEILEHPMLPQLEKVKELIRSGMRHVVNMLPGTHVFAMHTTNRNDPGTNNLPWFANLFHMRMAHQYMDQSRFERAWRQHIGGEPKKFPDGFPSSISVGAFLRYASQEKTLSLIPEMNNDFQGGQVHMLMVAQDGGRPDDAALKQLMDSVQYVGGLPLKYGLN